MSACPATDVRPVKEAPLEAVLLMRKLRKQSKQLSSTVNSWHRQILKAKKLALPVAAGTFLIG